MAGFPSKAKGNKLGIKARQPRQGVVLDKETLIKWIKEEDGNLSRVAEIIGCARHSVQRRVNDDPEIAQCLKDARERQLDMLEESCYQRAIETNDTTLQIFLLKTQGRSRGYDQSEAQHAAKDIATAAFDFILNKANESPKPSTT